MINSIVIYGFEYIFISEQKFIITEFVPNGDLQTFLRYSRGYGENGSTTQRLQQTFLQPKQLLEFALGIADGMAYLAAHNVSTFSRFLFVYYHSFSEPNTCFLIAPTKN